MLSDGVSTQDELEARRLRFYRYRPDVWCEDKLDFDFASYRSRDELQSFLSQYSGHEWCRQQFKAGTLTLDPSRSPQREALQSVANPGRYVFRWPNSAGKTVMGALACIWFLDCYPDGVVVTTAGTWGQVCDQLWREIPYWADEAEGDLVFHTEEMNLTGVSVDDKWYATARASSRESTFEGVHSKYVMVLFDEGKAIDKGIYDAARRILRGSESTIWWIALSTPGSPTGPFYKINQSPRWEVHTHSAYETTRLNLSEIHADAVELGEDSPLFVSMNLAQFPRSSEDTILPLSDLQSIVYGSEQAEENLQRIYEQEPRRRIGIDVARFGDDETVISLAAMGACEQMEGWNKKATTETVGRTRRRLQDWGIRDEIVAVDDTGVGGGVTDMLEELGVTVFPVRNNMPAERDDYYVNWITEAWFRYKWLIENGLAVLPDDKQLLNQLASRRYEYTSSGRLKVEGKKKMKKRGMDSPDRAESLMYATGKLPGGTGATEQIHEPESLSEMGEF